MIHELNFAQGFALGLVLGFLLGLIAVMFARKTLLKKEDMLAWTIAIIWIAWQVGSGFSSGAIVLPPSMFDIIAGGSIGFILGERFFDYVKGLLPWAKK